MKQAILDFESDPIEQRPDYPPKPAGLAFKLPGEQHFYAAWGHPEGNGLYRLKAKGGVVRVNSADPKRAAVTALKEAARCDSILGHNIAKFDTDLSESHMGVKLPADRLDDSLFSRFLVDPHSKSLSLKPSAEEVLGEPPEERDVVLQWLADHNIIGQPKKKNGKLAYPKHDGKPAGAFVASAPGDIAALYAIGDLTRAKGLWDHDMRIVKRDGMLEAYKREIAVAPILLESERRGMRVDVEALERDLPIYKSARAKVEKWLRQRLKAPAGINWDSDDEVANALEKSGVVKVFPKTDAGNRSVSKTNLTKRFFDDPDVYLALVYRNTVDYVLNQNIEPWLEQASKTGGYIFTIWQQVRSDADKGGARSGRITCSKWQNIIKNPTSGMNPDYMEADDARIRRKIGLPELPLSRRYCLPDAGDWLVDVDWNQQELRLLAHYEDGRLAKAYCDDPATDIHGFVKKLMDEIAKKSYEREPVKRADFLTAYGGGAPALSRRTGMSVDEARAFLSVWRKALPDVVLLNKSLMAMYQRGEAIRTIGGRLYRCKPAAIATKGDRRGEWVTFEYTALNYLLQPGGADLIKMAIINYYQHPKRRGRPLFFVHDELGASVPKKLAKQEQKVIQEVMEEIKLDVPWKTDGSVRKNWKERLAA